MRSNRSVAHRKAKRRRSATSRRRTGASELLNTLSNSTQADHAPLFVAKPVFVSSKVLSCRKNPLGDARGDQCLQVSSSADTTFQESTCRTAWRQSPDK